MGICNRGYCSCCGQSLEYAEKKIGSKSDILNKAAEFIIGFEGFHPTPYWDHKQWTWGYGTKASGKDGKISKDNAKKELIAYISQDYDRITTFSKKPLPESFIIALLSFSYNLGWGRAQNMISDFNTGKSLTEIAERMKLYVYASGIKLNGLVTRRNAETKLFV